MKRQNAKSHKFELTLKLMCIKKRRRKKQAVGDCPFPHKQFLKSMKFFTKEIFHKGAKSII